MVVQAGTIVYQETQATITNQFGLLTAQVGNGLVKKVVLAVLIGVVILNIYK